MTQEIILFVAGAVIALVSSLMTALFQHILTLRRHKAEWEREDSRREKEEFKQRVLISHDAKALSKEIEELAHLGIALKALDDDVKSNMQWGEGEGYEDEEEEAADWEAEYKFTLQHLATESLDKTLNSLTRKAELMTKLHNEPVQELKKWLARASKEEKRSFFWCVYPEWVKDRYAYSLPKILSDQPEAIRVYVATHSLLRDWSGEKSSILVDTWEKWRSKVSGASD